MLLPLSLVLALALVSQGVVQTFRGHTTATLVEATETSDGTPVTDQQIAVGPVASQIAIKQLGTNGGGFFNVNSAHPFENPTPLSNFLETLSILLIPAALCLTFGNMVRDRRQGWALLAAMFLRAGARDPPARRRSSRAATRRSPPLGADQRATGAQPGGNMEGKEARFGIASSAIWADCHDCGLQRLGELDARLLHAARGPRARSC